MVPEPARRDAGDARDAQGSAHPAVARARSVGELAARLLGAERGHVWFGPGTGTTEPEAETGAAVEIALGDDAVLRHPRDDGRPAARSLADVPALLAVPVVGDDAVRLGVLYVVAPAPRSWEAGEVALLEALATGVAEAVELIAARAAKGPSKKKKPVRKAASAEKAAPKAGKVAKAAGEKPAAKAKAPAKNGKANTASVKSTQHSMAMAPSDATIARMIMVMVSVTLSDGCASTTTTTARVPE